MPSRQTEAYDGCAQTTKWFQCFVNLHLLCYPQKPKVFNTIRDALIPLTDAGPFVTGFVQLAVL